MQQIICWNFSLPSNRPNLKWRWQWKRHRGWVFIYERDDVFLSNAMCIRDNFVVNVDYVSFEGAKLYQLVYPRMKTIYNEEYTTWLWWSTQHYGYWSLVCGRFFPWNISRIVGTYNMVLPLSAMHNFINLLTQSVDVHEFI